MKELREGRKRERKNYKESEERRLSNLVLQARIKRIDNEYDNGIYASRTLKPYEWQRGDGENGPEGEWKKVPKKSGVKVYTLPPRVEKYLVSAGAAPPPPKGDSDDDEEESPGADRGPPMEGNPITWYKDPKTKQWTQMTSDRLGYIDPTASYGRQIEREKRDKAKFEEQFAKQ